MRLNRFESRALKPLGEGDHKKVYINPENENRVIAEIKRDETLEKYSARQLKGAYYLTKIGHLLLPRHVPDIFQAGESVDGQQILDRQRIAHTQGHVSLQADREAGRGMEAARKQMITEMGSQMADVDLELERIGFSFAIDENVANYTKDERGNVQYLETFIPWKSDPVQSDSLELLFDKEDLVQAIEQTSDQNIRKTCEAYLKRILVLFEEEKSAHVKHLKDSKPMIKHIENLFAAYEVKHDLEALSAIQTEEIALKSVERKAAANDLPLILSQLNLLKTETNITNDGYMKLHDRYKKLSRAVGIISRGQVDHTR